MKSIFLSILLLCCAFLLKAQSITGSWEGTIKTQQYSLPLVFHIESENQTFKVSLDSPKQGASGIKADEVTFYNNQITIVFNTLQATYSGVFNGLNKINGTFSQAGQNLPLVLNKMPNFKGLLNAPETMVDSLNFTERVVSFKNDSANCNLQGTLTLPKAKGQFPVVILISGSGPQNRDGEIAGHKPFKMIAEYLSKHGIAVLRYDERGVGSSQGDFSKATSIDFAQDAEAAFQFLKSVPEINPEKIGYLGHSEGGIVAPMVAYRNKEVFFLVLLAGPILPGDEILFLQQQKINKMLGMSNDDIQRTVSFNKKAFELVKNETQENLKPKLRKLFEDELNSQPNNLYSGMDKDQFIELQISQLSSVWFKNFITYNPEEALKNINCEVLAIFAEKDVQVPAHENIEALQNIIQGNQKNNYVIERLASHNHLFQLAETGSPLEYAQIDHAISQEALELIKNWIKKQSGNK